MKKLHSLTALLLVCSLLLLTACTPAEEVPSPDVSSPGTEDSTPKQVQFALCYDSTQSLDPLATANTINLALAGLVYEGLFELDEHFSPQPLLCDGCSVREDGLVWTFTLRPGVTFSDGTPLTAAHAAASLNAARRSELYASRLAPVTAVKAVDEITLTVTLSTPVALLPALLDIPIVLSGSENAPLGTGPYSYETTGDGLALVRNARWWQTRELPVETIPLRAVSSAADQVAAFDTGLTSAVLSDPTSTNALGYSGSYETWTAPTASMLYLGFRCSGGLCADPVLRRAIGLALDRDTLSASLLSGYADPAVLPVSPHSPFCDAELASSLAYSSGRAAQLLAEEGYILSEDGTLLKWRKPVSLTLLVNSENAFRTAAAQAIADSLAALGITVTVKALPWSEFVAALQRGEFDLYLAQTKLTADFDLSALLTGELNYGGYWNSDVHFLLAAFRAAGDESSAAALYTALAADPPFTPLCFVRTAVFTRWGMVSGVNPTQQNPFHHFYTWELSQEAPV